MDRTKQEHCQEPMRMGFSERAFLRSGPGARMRYESAMAEKHRMTDEERAKESREALERVARDSETVGSSALARSGQRIADHFAGRDAVGSGEGGGTDPAELWGRRIGRALSLLGCIALAYWLGVQAGWW